MLMQQNCICILGKIEFSFDLENMKKKTKYFKIYFKSKVEMVLFSWKK